MTQQELVGYMSKIAQIPTRTELFCGQYYKYIRLEEAIYIAEDADSKIEQLHTENKALKTRIAELENEVKALEISLKRSNRLSKQRRDIIYMMSKNNKDDFKSRLAELEIVCDGLSQDAIDGGFTINGLKKYAMSVESENKTLKARIAGGVRV